jgi:D-alanine-D-alanine ligase
MSTIDNSVQECHSKTGTERICKHIAVVATNTEGMKETGSGSLETCRAVYDALNKRYQRVTFHEVTSTTILNDIVKEAPDLVVLTSKYFVENQSNVKTWFSQYFADRNIAFTGSDRNAMEFDSNKSKAKTLVQNNGLATAKYFLTHPDQYKSEKQLPISLPVFIKPVDAANSNGIDRNSVARDFNAYRRKVNELFEEFGVKVLVEEFLPGREFTIAILRGETNATRLTIPMEIIPPKNSKGDRILDGEAKRQNLETTNLVAEPLRTKMIAFADQIFEILGARDFGRIDVKIGPDDKLFFLEANLCPGMTPGTSYFPQAYILDSRRNVMFAGEPNVHHSDVVTKIVEIALSRSKVSV